MKGGKRIGSGRKSISPENKKVQISIYVEQIKVDKIGMNNIKFLCENAIDEQFTYDV